MVPLVVLLSPGEQDTEGEQSESPALNGPAGEGVDASLDDLAEVAGCSDVLKQAPPWYFISSLLWFPEIP